MDRVLAGDREPGDRRSNALRSRRVRSRAPPPAHRQALREGRRPRTANARLRALINIGLELASERDPERLLQSVCDRARDLFGATYVTLGIVDRHDERSTLSRMVVTCGIEDARWINTGDAVAGILRQRSSPSGGHCAARIPAATRSRLQLPSLHPRDRDIPGFAPSCRRPMSTAGSVSLGTRDGASRKRTNSWSLALAGQVGRIYELERRVLERQRRGGGPARMSGTGRSDISTPPKSSCSPSTSNGRITLINRKALRPARLARRASCWGATGSRRAAGPRSRAALRAEIPSCSMAICHRRKPVRHQVRRGTADRVA